MFVVTNVQLGLKIQRLEVCMGNAVRGKLVLQLALCLSFLAFSFVSFAQANPPNDGVPEQSLDPDASGAKHADVDQDDPTTRLEWERAMWGTVTPSFRTQAIKEGKRHGDRKRAAGPTWVNIGPTGA